jgi:hypothetical protein
MAATDQYSTREELLEALMAKVESDYYPSSTMLDMIESLLTPDDVPRYAEMLLERIRADEWPSIDMIKRVQALA